MGKHENLQQLWTVLQAANDLIHRFRNAPDGIVNVTDVDPVIRRLRVALAALDTTERACEVWLRQVAESYQAERNVHHIGGELVDAIRAEFDLPVIDRTSASLVQTLLRASSIADLPSIIAFLASNGCPAASQRLVAVNDALIALKA